MRFNLVIGLAAILGMFGVQSTFATTPAAYINNSMDNEFVWLEQGSSPLYPTKGLPHWGIVNATSDAASTFLMQPYTSNNVLLVQPASQPPAIPGVQTGTMTFVTPTLANSLAFAIRHLGSARTASALSFTSPTELPMLSQAFRLRTGNSAPSTSPQPPPEFALTMTSRIPQATSRALETFGESAR